MRKLFLVWLVGHIVLFATQAYGQDLSKYKNMDVSKLSEAQIVQISKEIDNRGYTMEQVKVMARAQGFSDQQISDLEHRLSRVQKNRTAKPASVATDAAVATETTVADPADDDRKMLFTKEDSLIFGFSLFNNQRLTFEPSVNIPVSDKYVLGTGDEILIDIWGLSQQSYQLEVSKNGNIDIPIAGPVYVAGRTFSDAKSAIMSKLKSIYSDLGSKTSASIKTGKLRTIRVNVMGEVFMPGSYTLPGTASLFNVLYLSGGPNSNGSFRNVQLIRNGRIVSTLDVYDFLINGNSSVNVPLFDDDIVMVPTYQKRIAVGGEFKRTGYFEAKEGETLADLITYAGGFKPTALAEHVGVYRVTAKGYEYKSVTDAKSMAAANGDSLVVAAVNSARFDNYVKVNGAVFAPGTYEYAEGITLSQMLAKCGGATENAFRGRGYITRLKDDYTLETVNFDLASVLNGSSNVALKRNDEIFIASIDDIREYPIVQILGAVKLPGAYAFGENMTVADLVLQAGGLLESAAPAHVEVVRRLSDAAADTSVTVAAEKFIVSLDRDLSLTSADNSFVLTPFDVVTIREYTVAKSQGTITISGEVRYPGSYSIVGKNDDVLSYIERAGGLTSNSYLKGAKLYRRVQLSKREQQIKRQMLSNLIDSTSQTIDDQLARESYELVSIDLCDLIAGKRRSECIILKDGDELYIPGTLQTVKASGQVLNPVSMVYVKGDNAKDIIMKAGGFSAQAKKGKTFVIYPDGKAMATKRFLFFRNYPAVEPGCEVVVPEKPQRKGTSVAEIIGLTGSMVTIAALVVSLL